MSGKQAFPCEFASRTSRELAPPADAWTRRDVLRNGFASAALLCTVATPASLHRRRSVVTSAALRAQSRSPFEPFRRDLPRIPELVPVRRTHTTDFYESAIGDGMADVLPGFQTPIYGYEGIYPGPTIRAKRGRRVVIRQQNDLGFESNVHLHGGYVTAGHDGHPMDVIAAGKSFEYHYPNHQDAASLWYHDHAHGRTSRTLYYGLVAMYVLEDDLERELDLPTGDYDVPIVIADHRSTRTARSATSRTSTSASAATRWSSTARSRRACASSGASTACAS